MNDIWEANIAALKASSKDMAALEYAKALPPMRYKPRAIMNLDDFRAEIDSLLGKRKGIFAGAKRRRFFTFGSCFANNIVAYLQAIGASANTSMMPEDVNSPFNNVIMLRRIVLRESHPVSDELGAFPNVDYDAMHKDLFSATDVIVTLGNIFRMTKDGRPVLRYSKGVEIVEETLEETVSCLEQIALLLSREGCNLYATVSPIPISAYIGNQYKSIMEADCASKSQLRTAIRRVPQFTYLPIFEIIKWLAPHKGFPTFGGDDRNPRHITKDQLKTVMEALC